MMKDSTCTTKVIDVDYEFSIFVGLALLKPKTEIVFGKYLEYLLNHEKVRKNLENAAPGSTRKTLTINAIKKFEIPLPSLEEQIVICGILDKVWSLVQKRERVKQLTNKIIQSVFIKMFGDPIKNTKGFELTKLPTVARLERGKFGHRPKTEPRFYSGKYPFIQIGDIPRDSIYIKSYTQTLNEKGLAISKMFPRGTIVIAIAATIGEVGILNFNSCFPDSLVGITPNKYRMKPEYLYIFLTFMKKRLIELAPLTAQRNINLKILSEIDIPIPPMHQQQKFSDFVQNIEKIRARQGASTIEINALFHSIMYKAFRGELIAHIML